ncbi:MAG TPA: CHAT domain-containing protein [Ilumatobacter sp.]
MARNIALGVADERSLGVVDTHAIALAQLMLPDFEKQRPIDPRCEPSPVVVIPLSLHMGVAWSLLPALATRPVTVAPTLRHWISHAGDGQSIGDVALIEGVQLAGSEIADVADVWATRSPAVLHEAMVADTLDALQRVDLIHLACHGSRRARDGRFAQLKMADGDLVSFELERLTRTPRVVVLAACEAGLLEPLPGDEAAGIATALFGATTATVVAPVVVVPDTSLTHKIFVDVHRFMSRGLSPSEALFAAQSLRTDPAERVIARSISCFGRG